MEIRVGKKYVTQIDDEEYELVKDIPWWIVHQGIYKTPYVYSEYGMMSRMIMNTPADMVCDHKNGDTLDNRKANLRNCTQAQNLMNQPKYGGKSSKFKGVSWYPNYSKWRARINFEGKTILLGYFESETDAAKAYDDKAVELYGEFAFRQIFGAQQGDDDNGDDEDA